MKLFIFDNNSQKTELARQNFSMYLIFYDKFR